MSSAERHSVLIERHGMAHRARCACGWSGHLWNELRPAEADAWHHTFGDERVVEAAPQGDATTVWPTLPAAAATITPVEHIVDVARALARGSAPHRPAAIENLAQVAQRSTTTLTEAGEYIGELLRRHARRSKSTADEEWLELHTARRLIEAARADIEV